MPTRNSAASDKKPRSRSKQEGTDRLSRSENLLQQIEEQILLGQLPPGSRLDEKQLAERFKVSRTPVREALWHLASSGLVDLRRHHGAIVKKLTLVELVEMFQVMAELEGLCARLSARRMTLAERKSLKEIQKVAAKRIANKDHEGFFQSNNEFHEVIFEGSRNKFLQQESRSIRNRVNPYRRYITYQPGRMEKSHAEHEAIVQAIESGNDELAHQLMRDHVNMLGEVVADFIASLSELSLSLTQPEG
ncbi:MAG: GntR family transcriptional regulator [Pseudolabrys sp.]